MARGKYAARAANRLAEIDAGLVEELREKLAAVTAERDVLRAEAEQLRRDVATEARSLADRLAEGAVSELAAKLIEARDAREADRLHYAMAVSKVINQPGIVKAPLSFWADLADAFGLKGVELTRFIGKKGGNPRGLTRANTQDLRHVDDLRTQARGKSNAVAMRLDDGS